MYVDDSIVVGNLVVYLHRCPYSGLWLHVEYRRLLLAYKYGDLSPARQNLRKVVFNAGELRLVGYILAERAVYLQYVERYAVFKGVYLRPEDIYRVRGHDAGYHREQPM